MTFFRKLTMLNRLPSWSWIPVAVFLALLANGSLLGLTDDEAYYWVLAQRPSLGYAFHPPAVAWSIALVQTLLGPFFGHSLAGLVRLPAALYAAGVLALALGWIESVGGRAGKSGKTALTLVAVAGVYGAAWMMVPDLPLLFGWMLVFVSAWRICFGPADVRAGTYVALLLGVALAVLSKFSGVMVAGSAGLAILLWARREKRVRGCLAVIAGAFLAVIPIVWWNATHGWGSLLYQFHDRHGGATFSGARYLRFWGSQVLLVGPALMAYSFLLVRRLFRKDCPQVTRYVAVWAAPAALAYFIQPAWADFKPHWALVVWFPVALELAWTWSEGRDKAWAWFHVSYGFSMIAVALLLCHVPVGSWLTQYWTQKEPDPRWDVTNDMYGWDGLKGFLGATSGIGGLPVIGSRYQTSAQAAFAVGDASRVSLVPRDQKQMDEWPSFSVVASQGPGWPRLLGPVLFVADNRYSSGPSFPESRCEKLGRIEKKRWGAAAKWIDLWRCEPKNFTVPLSRSE